MRSKLGIFNEEAEDEALFERLLGIMHKQNADYTNTFIELTFDRIQDTKLYDAEEFKDWYHLWKERLTRQNRSKEDSQELMRNSNPAVIPRNHRVEEALEAAVKYNDYSRMEKLLKVLSKPYAHSEDQEEYKELPKPSSCKYKTYCGT